MLLDSVVRRGPWYKVGSCWTVHLLLILPTLCIPELCEWSHSSVPFIALMSMLGESDHPGQLSDISQYLTHYHSLHLWLISVQTACPCLCLKDVPSIIQNLGLVFYRCYNKLQELLHSLSMNSYHLQRAVRNL